MKYQLVGKVSSATLQNDRKTVLIAEFKEILRVYVVGVGFLTEPQALLSLQKWC